MATPYEAVLEARRERHTARLRAYRSGKNDIEIGEIFGETANTIQKWRAVLGLAANVGRGKHPRPEAAANMVYYQLGWSDVRIARERKVLTDRVYKWRHKLGLPPNNLYNRALRPAFTIQDLVGRVRRAVGRKLPVDIVEDTVADMLLAIMAGKIPLTEVEAEARKYGNRVLERFASKFGPRSLDEEIGVDGFTLLDTLVDDSSSSWLEEMGATAW